MKHTPGPTSQRKWWLRGLTVLILLMLLIAAVALGLTRCQPIAYIPSDPRNPAVAARGETLENAAAAQLTAVRPDADGAPGKYVSAPWSVAVTQEDANAWLATRLEDWLRSRGASLPYGLLAPSVSFSEDGLLFCAPVETPAGVTVVSLPIMLTLGTDGGLDISFGTAWAGLLPVPGASAVVLTTMRTALKQDITHEGLRIATPIISVDDGRHVRLTGVRAGSGRIELTFQTEEK
jgi:hypothetical protein